MTPSEKAKDLFYTFSSFCETERETKIVSLKCVEEIINEREEFECGIDTYNRDNVIEYWIKVKEEINNI